MTNEEQLELIAQARESLVRQIAYEQKDFQSWRDACDSAPYASTRQRGQVMVELAIGRLYLAKTHLAEMDEHEGLHTDYGYVCQKCSKSFSQNGMTIRQYPCDFLVTKAKRLLGVG